VIGMSGKSTRRAFFSTVARVAGLVGLGGIVWASTSRSRDGRSARLPCDRCPALPSCSLPDSLQARDAGRRNGTSAPASDPTPMSVIPIGCPARKERTKDESE
jgi:hypothetical protein